MVLGRHAHAAALGGHVGLRAARRVHQPGRGGVRTDGRLAAPAGHSRRLGQGTAVARVVRSAGHVRPTRGHGRRRPQGGPVHHAQ